MCFALVQNQSKNYLITIMLMFITKGIAKLLGNKSTKDIKKIYPYVEKIHQISKILQGIDHDALRAKTMHLKQKIQDALAPIKAEIEKNNTALKDSSLNISKKKKYLIDIEKLQKDYYQQIEKVLQEALPEAFAIVKETAKRFKENSTLLVKATACDVALAEKKDYVTLKDNYALWHNQWEAGGNSIIWDMVHYDVQLIGGIILHQGKIAEMATGEGKTLVATLPAFLNALVGEGVHIVTVNNYLAKRDAEWMGPIFEFHGLTVNCIDLHESHSIARKQAYQADIIYGTNNEFGFDYLRDNMVDNIEETVQRKHHYAIIDEVDSVLIDDARTPLIISGPVSHSNEQDYSALQSRVSRLYEAQKQITIQFLQQAKKQIANKKEKEGGLALFRSLRGLPKYKPLIKYLSETGIKQIVQKTENYYLQDNERMMPEADEPLLFVIDEKNNNIELTEKGIEYITQGDEGKNFFILPDIATQLTSIDKDIQLTDKEKITQKENLIKEYTTKAQRIHTLTQLLKAYTLFEKDVEYIVMHGRVKIVDEQTGRVLEGRRYSDGLHQALEAKENVRIEKSSQTYANITLQNYFRMYHKLAGMTGTAETEAGEFWEIYKLDVTVAPTHRKVIRDDRQDKVYKTTREKFQSIIEEIVLLTKNNRPVLVGTTSVEISELVSKMLKLRKINHQVLNAKHHEQEAQIVAQAGQVATVTIATNMAGRGTDIKLTSEAKKAGGLAIIGTERHESRRVDRQLRGRSGRQGDVGSSQFFVSLEDDLMRLFGSDRIARIMDRMGLEDGEVIQHAMITRSIERAQKRVEQDNFGIRKRLLEYDNVMNAQRNIIYKKRNNALKAAHIDLDIDNMIIAIVEKMIEENNEHSPENFRLKLISTLGIDIPLKDVNLHKKASEKLFNTIQEAIVQKVKEQYQKLKIQVNNILYQVQRNENISNSNFIFSITNGKTKLYISIECIQTILESKNDLLKKIIAKQISIHFIDKHWQEHLRILDNLRQSVQNAVYEQKDPLLVYKFEAYKIFKQLVHHIHLDIITFMLNFEPYTSSIIHHKSSEILSEESKKNMQAIKQDFYQDKEEGTSNEYSSIVPLAKNEKIAKRNERVTVQYLDGTIKENVKYKIVADDIEKNNCIVIEN